jgi:hypothetical protein
MKKNYSDEVKELIKRYNKEEDIVLLKSDIYITKRNNTTTEEIKREILEVQKLYYTEKQERQDGVRYALFFKYSNKKGRCYVIEFNNKIKVVTVFPLGKKTLKKYELKRFIK